MPRALAILLAAILLAPVGAASWRAAGGLEPDTPEDLAHGSMWKDAPEGKSRRVYFQGFIAAEGTSLNPNAGATGSRLWPAGNAHHRAILGVWTDCNDDGYIGLAESAVQDYSIALLLDNARCEPTPDSDEPVHNDGVWVNELLTIGMVDPCEHTPEQLPCRGLSPFAKNERVHYLPGTTVWADLGLPGARPEGECVIAPVPRGTTSSSGALIGWADCQSARGIARAINEADRDGSAGLRFDDPSRPQDSTSLLNQPAPVLLFGAPGRTGLLQEDGARSATVWDCGEPRATTVNAPPGAGELALSDPTGLLAADTFPMVIPHALTGIGFEDEDGDDGTAGVLRLRLADQSGALLWLPRAAPETHEPTGSAWGTFAYAADGPNSDCDHETPNAADDLYFGDAIESGPVPVLEERKSRTSFAFTFYDGHRGVHPRIDERVGPTTPSDGGLFYTDHDRSGDGPLWSADAGRQNDPQLVDRRDLQPEGALHVTYYAFIGSLSGQDMLLANDASTTAYGKEACGSFTTGVRNGWICDASLWWKDINGQDARPAYADGTPYGRVVGDPYHLRDVDCYDGSPVEGLGLRASLADLTGTNCPPAEVAR